MGPTPHLSFCACKTTCLSSELSWVPAFICGFFLQNSDFWNRINSLYGSHPSFVVFPCKTETLGPELQVFTGPRLHPWFFCTQNSVFSTRIEVPMGPKPSSVVFACKTATFGSELIVSIGPRPHLMFCAIKTA